ncbi:MAG: HEAT repeat domain-containing protein [Ignavibacteria bacterium]|nr:HEAT repeat domain-containing protein [Ignavibacteria bacterium]MCU7499382.1 HEAT repeat domain-containing protein [Ignavibacteria bacterium]MCU7513467.1 HEAT repeat domain-containing protein [Ignavibacteria bacterium]MCU7518917.1 HEAT repeat domain-containing protein [Ignavibacteria bacterium]MCU7525139.1 HEAT repeat domain-containing protein [Ignavibacteria bacterium]
MKRNTLKRRLVKSSSLLAAALLVMILLTSTSSFAQTNSVPVKALVVNRTAIGNLIMGIESDNTGLSRSSIYYAGLYRVPEAVKPLLEKMRSESDASTKILIALALFRIGDPEGMDMIESLSVKDPDSRVRRMCSAIFNEYVSPDSLNYVAR